MSWTVQEEPRHEALALEKLLSRVVDDDADIAPSPEKKSTSDSMNSPFHHLKTSFISPAPLTPSDLQVTPVKDPLESFNSWMRTQTPGSGSRGTSPTPASAGFGGDGTPIHPLLHIGGAGVHHHHPAGPHHHHHHHHLGQQQHHHSHVSRPLLFGTPQKYSAHAPTMDPTLLGLSGAPTGATALQTASLGGALPAGPVVGTAGGVPIALSPTAVLNGATPKSLDAIYETRRLLMSQMEELALAEMELRQSPHSDRYPDPMDLPMGVAAGGQPHSPMSPHSSMASPAMQITADSIRGRVYETAKDQHGCRFLQRWLDSNYDGEAAQVIMAEIVPHVPELMTDQYANFLVQKLFDIMPHDVRYNVAQVAAPHMTQIALTPHGTFSVQKLIETIATREEMEIVRESLSHDVVMLVKNVHGNHVIQKVLQRFEHPDKQFIYDAVIEDCAGIATNKQGCCVLQRCLEFASPPQRQQLVRSILQCAIPIVQDPFGNYVLQYVLEAQDVSVNDTIAMMFLPHMLRLSMNKFSSNVMEKVLRGSSITVRDDYVTAMKDANVLSRMIQDDYGNYVVQTALTVSTAAHAEGLVTAIRPLMPLIRNAPYAKKLEAKMELVLKKKGGLGSPMGGAGAPHHHHQRQQFSPYGGGNPHHMQQAPQQQPHDASPMHGGIHGGAPQRGGGFPRPFRPTAQPWSPMQQQQVAPQ